MLSDNHPNYPKQQDGEVITRGNGALLGRWSGGLKRDFGGRWSRKIICWFFPGLKHLEVTSGVANLIFLLYFFLQLFLALLLLDERRIVLELHFKLRRRLINRLEQNGSIVLLPITCPINLLHFHLFFLLHSLFAFRWQKFVLCFGSDHPLGILLQKVLGSLFKITKDDCTVLEAIRFTIGVGQNLIYFWLHLRVCAILDHPHKLSTLWVIIDLHIAGKFLQAYPSRREMQEDLREGRASERRGALQAENLGLHLRYYYIDTSWKRLWILWQSFRKWEKFQPIIKKGKDFARAKRRFLYVLRWFFGIA